MTIKQFINDFKYGFSKIGKSTKIFAATLFLISIILIVYLGLKTQLKDGSYANFNDPNFWLSVKFGMISFILGFLGSYLAGLFNAVTSISDVTNDHIRNIKNANDTEIKSFINSRLKFFFIRLSINPTELGIADSEIIREAEWDWQVCFLDTDKKKNDFNNFERLYKIYWDTSSKKLIQEKNSHLTHLNVNEFNTFIDNINTYFKGYGINLETSLNFDTTKSILLSGVVEIDNSLPNPTFIQFENIEKIINNIRVDTLIFNLESRKKNLKIVGNTAELFGKYIIEKCSKMTKINSNADLFYTETNREDDNKIKLIEQMYE